MARTLAMPLQVRGGRLVTLEHGSPLEVAQSVALLVATRPGQRRTVPAYGLPEQLFAPAVDPAKVAASVTAWEDRADDMLIAQALATDVAGVTTATVDVALRTQRGTARSAQAAG